MFDLDHMQSLADLPRVQARTRPNATAQIFEERRTSFAAFDGHTCQIAQGLIAAGLAPQTRIGFLTKNSDRYFELLFGAAKANTVVVGINWRLAPPEIEFVLNHAGCACLFVGAEYYAIAEQLRVRCRQLNTIIALDGGHTNWPAFDDWRAQHSAVDPALPCNANDDVVQLYTSGTTGHPKGVQLTHANFRALFRAGEAAHWGLFDAGDVVLICTPVFHVAGANMGIFALGQGATNLIMKEVDAHAILDLIPSYRVNHALFVPAVILALTQLPQIAHTDLSSMKKRLYGASPIAEELLKTAGDLFDCDFYGLYGLTETAGAGTCLQPDAHVGGKLRSCGKP